MLIFDFYKFIRMKAKSIEEFYQEISGGSSTEPNSLLPNDIPKEIGHFNVFFNGSI